MQPMGDGIAGLGSRLGLIFDPGRGKSYLLDCDAFPGIELDLQAGVRVDGRTALLPISRSAPAFEFCDQRSTPTTVSFIGIDPETALRIELTVTAPFRPRDLEFSCTPALDIECRLSKLKGAFRWTRPRVEAPAGELFIKFGGIEARAQSPERTALSFEMQAQTAPGRRISLPQTDVIHWHTGAARGSEAALPFDFGSSEEDYTLHGTWCRHSAPVLHIGDEPAPFRYAERFPDMESLLEWARANPGALRENSAKVDALLADHRGGRDLDHLLAFTLHSWLVNTWLVSHPVTGRPHFTVWEGSCYFHSTVDVEYTQAPFYLSVWPELLGMELAQWREYMLPGGGGLFLCHDMGCRAYCGEQAYPHHMEVEENANWILMAHGYWRRTGERAPFAEAPEALEGLLDFLLQSDTTESGIPDRGVANTIDDGSPAIQFGREQVYLAVKTLAALDTGAGMLQSLGLDGVPYLQAAGKIRKTLDEKGWAGDHFVTCLDSSAEGVINPWDGRAMRGTMPGWDSAQIYTTNGLVLLDMTGRDSGIDEERLAQDLTFSTAACLRYYGCGHTAYAAPEEPAGEVAEGLAGSPGRSGWISMNMLRDTAAAYRGIDLLDLLQRYWEYQATANAREVTLFFETFSGNNLNFYPRGLAVYGLLDAMLGLRIDRVAGSISARPLRPGFTGPVLLFADWRTGTAPRVTPNGSISPAHLAREGRGEAG